MQSISAIEINLCVSANVMKMNTSIVQNWSRARDDSWLSV